MSAVHRNALWRGIKTSSGTHIALTVPEVIPLGLSTGGRIFLRSTLLFHFGDHPEFKKERKVVTDEYAHTLSQDELLKDEIVSWHWQPGSRPDPHLHIGARISQGGPPKRHHIPTGRVAFEHVLKYAIEECGARPSLKKAVALAQINESLRRFEAYRSWA